VPLLLRQLPHLVSAAPHSQAHILPDSHLSSQPEEPHRLSIAFFSASAPQQWEMNSTQLELPVFALGRFALAKLPHSRGVRCSSISKTAPSVEPIWFCKMHVSILILERNPDRQVTVFEGRSWHREMTCHASLVLLLIASLVLLSWAGSTESSQVELLLSDIDPDTVVPETSNVQTPVDIDGHIINVHISNPFAGKKLMGGVMITGSGSSVGSVISASSCGLFD